MHPAKLLVDLDDRIRNTADRISWARDVCRKASYLARMGHSKSALNAIAGVRNELDKGFEPEAGCWLMIAEGVLHFFEMRQTEAYDSFRGAYGVASTFDAKLARPTSAAWMAHIEFNENRFDLMIRFLHESLTLAEEEDHQARGRASLVMADALHFAGQFAKARPWYERTRLHATAEGDRAMLSAFLHNVAAFRAANVRLADAFGESAKEEAKRALLEAASANNYDTAVGTASFTLLVPLLQSQLLAVERRYYDALMILARLDGENLPVKLQPLVAVEKAWCSIGLGLRREGKEFAQHAAASIGPQLEPDDCAYALARLASIEDHLGQTLLPSSRELAHSILNEHRALQRQLEAKLDKLLEALNKQQ